MSKNSQIIRNIILKGTPEEKRVLFGFTEKDSNEKIYKKFKLFSTTQYTRYFKDGNKLIKSSPAHKEMIFAYIDSWRGSKEINAGSRDMGKTALLKLFNVFVLLNDLEQKRKYIKVNSKNLKNSVQMVTDIYNMIIEVEHIYGDVFEKEGKIKREEKQGSFTMKGQVKVVAGTVGEDQRGFLQDAYRPDWLQFEDIEDRTSISSQVITQGIILRAQEAIDGMAKGGGYIVNCNYISENGVIQWFKEKESTNFRNTPIATDVEYGTDETGKKTIVKATPVWERYSFDDILAKYKDAEDWYGEYMGDPARTGDKFFDIDIIDKHIQLYAEPPKRKAGLISYWTQYNPSHRYGQGSDHSEGVGLDSNTLVGFDFTTGEQTYSYASNTISPDLAAEEFARVGAEFGNCIFAPEVNNKCGGIVITTLKDIPYPNIYRYKVTDKVNNVLSNKLGWDTNRRTKNTMYFDFRRDFNDGLIKIKDINLLREMRSYTNSDIVDDTATKNATRHFDLLTAACIAWQMRNSANRGNAIKDYYDNLSGKKRTVAS